jgi:hypothetical protein
MVFHKEKDCPAYFMKWQYANNSVDISYLVVRHITRLPFRESCNVGEHDFLICESSL